MNEELNVLIPLIRKILPGMIAHEICGIQPMTGLGTSNRDRFIRAFNVVCDNNGGGSAGKIFTMKPKYGNSLP